MRREEAEAEAECRRLEAEVPPGARVDPLSEEIRADEKPPTPDDPRTSYARNVGSDWFG